MKYVVIKWQDRLDDLYFIAGETGEILNPAIMNGVLIGCLR